MCFHVFSYFGKCFCSLCQHFYVFSRVIFDAFSNPDPTKKDNTAGIQLLGIVAANGLSPISSDSTIDEER